METYPRQPNFLHQLYVVCARVEDRPAPDVPFLTSICAKCEKPVYLDPKSPKGGTTLCTQCAQEDQKEHDPDEFFVALSEKTLKAVSEIVGVQLTPEQLMRITYLITTGYAEHQEDSDS